MTAVGEFIELLCCPECRAPDSVLETFTEELRCVSCAAGFPLSKGRPVLLRHDNALFPHVAYREAFSGPSRLRSRLRNLVPSPSVNLSFKTALARIRRELDGVARPGIISVLIVGGGRQRRAVDAALGAGPSLRTIYSDVDVHADVELFCDGHELPFRDGSVDVVITTAVLEHVLYPERAASEIHRVLKRDGLLYSEVPFMCQVHEGAYDFTRYTLSGHRRLFNGFREVDSGMVAGPATALVWTLEYFTLSFFRSDKLRLIARVAVRVLFFWLKYLDYLLKNQPQAFDAAAGTYFLGAKLEGRVDDASIIAGYVGGQRVRHV
jgi:SAM-dependent methyltransferase